MKSKPSKFLLIRTDRLGDVVLTAPAIGVLRHHFPTARISFLTRSYTAPLLKHYRGLDDVISLPDFNWNNLPRLVHLLKTRQFDAAILFSPTPLLALAIWLARIPCRVGTGYRWYSFLLNKRIYEHRKYGQRHELEYNLNLLRPFCTWQREQVHFAFQFSPELQAWWEQVQQNAPWNSSFIVVHPGSGGSSPNLSLRQYAALVRFLLQQTRDHILLTGSAAEEAQIRTLHTSLHSPRLSMYVGQFNLEQLAMVLAHARLAIAGSTGPLHLAAAMGTPVLGFYCPSPPCSPRRWGPYFQLEWAVTPDVQPCKHCRPARCPNGNCLEVFTEEDLRAILHRRLESLTPLVDQQNRTTGNGKRRNLLGH